MSKPIEDKLEKIPGVNLLVKFFKSIKLKVLEGLSLYDLLELYVIGIVKGALSTRASAIAYPIFCERARASSTWCSLWAKTMYSQTALPP